MRRLFDLIYTDFGTTQEAEQGDLLQSPDMLDFPNETVQSQYSASEAIRWLCQYDASLLSPVTLISLFRNFIFHPLTAAGFGLDVWGRIVGIARGYEVESKEWLGFDGSETRGFDQAPFWAGVPVYDSVTLSDLSFRDLIFYKAAANIGSADAAGLNQLLQRMFPGKEIYALDLGSMTIRLMVGEELSDAWWAILRQYGLIARGAGVGVEIMQYDPDAAYFGFNGSGGVGFDQGQFWAGSIEILNA